MGDRYRYPRPRSPTLYNAGRASAPLDAYHEYPPSPIRGDHLIQARREVIPGPRSSNSSIASGPTTTTTYKISSDPLTRGASLREGNRIRRSTLDGPTSNPMVPILVNPSHAHKPRDRPVVHAGAARPPSPLQDPYRSSQEEYYAIPASSGRVHHHRPKGYMATRDDEDMNLAHLRAAPPQGHTYTRPRPVYSGPVVRDTANYGDDGYGYTTPSDLVQWDLNNSAAVPRQPRSSSYDRGRPISITGYNDIAPPRAFDNRPPVSTRGFDRIPQTARVAPPTAFERDRMEGRMTAPAPLEPVRPVRMEAQLEGPRRSDSKSMRPASYYHDRERRGSGREDYYEVRDDEPRYRGERSRLDRRENVIEQRGAVARADRDEPLRSERHDRGDPPRSEPRSEHRPEKERHDDDYKDHKRYDDDYKEHKRREDDPKDHKDHKARDAAVAGLSLAGAALGVKAFKDSGDDHDDRDDSRRRRDYDDEPRRRRDPRDGRDPADLSREPPERRHRDESPPRDVKDRSTAQQPEILQAPGRDPKERHGSRDGRDSDLESRRRLAEGPLNGSAIETESSASDETQQRRTRARRESGPGFNPRDTMDLRALKEALNKEPAAPIQPPPPGTPRESMNKDSRALAEIRSDLQNDSPTPRIVTPAPSSTDSKTPVKGILRAPREKFPEDPAPIREGVAPLKDAKKDGVPPAARWTKISRKLVNPEALEAGKERYEAREDFVIVLRVLSRDEVQTYAEVTERIRSARAELEEEEARTARRRARRERHERHKRDRAERAERGTEPQRPSSRSNRHHRRDKESHSESDTTSDSYAEKGDKIRDRRPSGERDGGRVKALEASSLMSGGLGSDEKKVRVEEKKPLPSRADLMNSTLRENPDAPGQYIGYTRNPPAS